MEGGALDFLRTLLLFADGVAMVCAAERAYYYRQIRFEVGFYRIYVYFLTLAGMYFITTFSDLCVVAQWPIWWARTPVIRGLVLRVPHAMVLFYICNKRLVGRT
jgi:hypothetical protein